MLPLLRNRFAAGQRDLLARIAGGAPIGELLEEVVGLIEQDTTWMLCSILLVDRAAQCLRLGAAPSLPRECIQALDGFPMGPQSASCGTAAHTGQRVIVEDIATHPHWAGCRRLALSYGLRAPACARPIWSGRFSRSAGSRNYNARPSISRASSRKRCVSCASLCHR